MKTIENCAALTIAGSDPGGGAGIQADLKTFSAFGVYGTSVITAVTAQNRNGVTAIQPVEPGVVQKQLESVLEAFPIKAIKTGMLFSSEIIETIAAVFSTHRRIPLIIDPVFTATSGRELLQDDAVESLKEKLFPLATLITPNIPEAEILTGEPLRNTREMERAVSRLYRKYHVPVLLKGGHLPDRAVDIFFAGKEMERFESELIEGVDTHGSGCSLASAITAVVARGEALEAAVERAKIYITHALKGALQLSPGCRVINHFPYPFDQF